MTDRFEPNIESFSLYRSVCAHPMLNNFNQLIRAFSSDPGNPSFRKEYLGLYYELKARMFEYAFTKNESSHYAKTPWQDFIIAQVITDENPLTLAFEKTIFEEDHPFFQSLLKEIQPLLDLYAFDWDQFLQVTGLDDNNIFQSPVFFPVTPYDKIMLAMNTGDLVRILAGINSYIYENGVGIFEKNLCFSYDPESGKLVPQIIRNEISMDDLIGLEQQKAELSDNISAFIRDYSGLNVLLHGAPESGKTSLIKALTHSFRNTKLRRIDLSPEAFGHLPAIFDLVADRPYAFVIFIDGLSPDDCTGLRALLDDCAEAVPDNVLFCAVADKALSELILSEKRAADRETNQLNKAAAAADALFGLSLVFTAPTQEEYLAIATGLAERAGLNMNEHLLKNMAVQWELRHLSRTAGTAKQLIEYLKVKNN